MATESRAIPIELKPLSTYKVTPVIAVIIIIIIIVIIVKLIIIMYYNSEKEIITVTLNYVNKNITII